MKEKKNKNLIDIKNDVFTSKFCKLITLSGMMIDRNEEHKKEYEQLVNELSKKLTGEKVGNIIFALSFLLVSTTETNKEVLKFVSNIDADIKTRLYIG